MNDIAVSLNSNDPSDIFADFLGKYTIILNGTIIEARAEQPNELSVEHKQEVVEKFNRLLIADRKAVLERVRRPLSKYREKMAHDFDADGDVCDAVCAIDEALSEIERAMKGGGK